MFVNKHMAFPESKARQRAAKLQIHGILPNPTPNRPPLLERQAKLEISGPSRNGRSQHMPVFQSQSVNKASRGNTIWRNPLNISRLPKTKPRSSRPKSIRLTQDVQALEACLANLRSLAPTMLLWALRAGRCWKQHGLERREVVRRYAEAEAGSRVGAVKLRS